MLGSNIFKWFKRIPPTNKKHLLINSIHDEIPVHLSHDKIIQVNYIKINYIDLVYGRIIDDKTFIYDNGIINCKYSCGHCDDNLIKYGYLYLFQVEFEKNKFEELSIHLREGTNYSTILYDNQSLDGKIVKISDLYYIKDYYGDWHYSFILNVLKGEKLQKY